MALAGFSAGEAEGLRRAMSRKRSEAAMQLYQRALHRGRGRARSGARRRRAGLRADPGLLGLRLPEGARGRLRPARLPVDLAARPLRAGVPVRAAERAADGLLPARRARPRRAAARDDGPASRTSTAAAAECSVERRDSPCGSGSATSSVSRRRKCAGWSKSGSAAGSTPMPAISRAFGSRARHARAARVGGRLRRVDAPRGALAARRRDTGAGGAGRRAALAPARGCPSRRALRELTAWERLVADYGSFRISLARAPAGAAAAGPAGAGGLEHAAWSACRTGASDGRRPGGRPPAPGDREGRHVHAARGRVGDDQPDRPAAGLRAPPPDRAHGAVRDGARPARAPRGRDQRARRDAPALERPDLPRADVKHIEPPVGRETGRDQPTCARSCPPATASAAAGARATERSQPRRAASCAAPWRSARPRPRPAPPPARPRAIPSRRSARRPPRHPTTARPPAPSAAR